MTIAALPILLTGFTSQASLIVAVGAQNAFVIRQGIARSHVPAIVGICIAADAILITLGTRGMGAVVERHPSAMSALTWIGAAVLMLYAVLAFKRVFARVRALRRYRADIAEHMPGGADISVTDAAVADTAVPGAAVADAIVTDTATVASTEDCSGHNTGNSSVAGGGRAASSGAGANKAIGRAASNQPTRNQPTRNEVSHRPQASDTRRTEQSPLRTDVMACLGFTFLNPNVYLDTIVLMGGLAATYGTTLKWSFAAGAILCSVLWFTLLGALSVTMSRLFHSTQAWIALDSVIGVAMVLISLHLALG
jgi:L-lysine exporter family protein LysE/ArgO